RNSRRRNTTGATDSVASTGIVRTPDGKEVALSPSFCGRAPAPPQWKITVLNSGSVLASVPSSTSSTSEPPPNICGFQSDEAPSAGTGITCCRQPNTTSGSICPTVWRAATGHGRLTLRTQPSGALTLIGARDRALFATPGATRHLTPNAV